MEVRKLILVACILGCVFDIVIAMRKRLPLLRE